MFTDVVGFTKICSQIKPMQVVDMLNNMYTRFDKLTEKHKVYKVNRQWSFSKKNQLKFQLIRAELKKTTKGPNGHTS